MQEGEERQYVSANLTDSVGLLVGAGVGSGTDDESDLGSGADRQLVEPDVIRREGNLLYILNQYRGLSIVDLETESVLSQTPTYGSPRDLYFSEGRAYVLVSYARDIKVNNALITVTYGSLIYTLNVENPTEVFVEDSIGFEGDLIDSRLVGDVIYAVCSEYTSYECCENGAVSTETAEKSYGKTGAISINIADSDNIRMVDTQSFDGYGNLIQATNDAIFVVTNDYNTDENFITYVDITDPEGKILIRGFAVAPGYMTDKFKMDAWNGTLRTVTNTWWPDRQTYVTTFDITDPDNITQLGQTALASASGESLYATRFDGPRAYVVTYLTIDPLFVVDLADATAPVVAGELKIPGWSTYIEPRGDRLIALGVDDQEGRRVKVSLFDVSNPVAPQQIDTASFGEQWSWSSAYDDVKSLTVLDDMILVPFSGWNDNTDAGYDRLQFVSYSRDSLDVQGYVDVEGSVTRSFEYADKFYAVTQEQLAVIEAGDVISPVVENTLVLAENVVDVLPLANGSTVDVVLRYNAGETLLRARDQKTGFESTPVVLPVSNIHKVFEWKNGVVIVAPVYEYKSDYRSYFEVYLVDFTNTGNPVVARRWTAIIEPWWPGDAAVLAEDFLVLRGKWKTGSQGTYGNEDERTTFAVIDLADVDNIRYVDCDSQNITSIQALDNLVYITTYDKMPEVAGQGSYCAYYLQTLNPFSLEKGNRINVPGVLLHRVPDTNYFIMKDLQYSQTGGAMTLLRSVVLSEESAQLVDSVEFGIGYWEYAAVGEEIFFSGKAYSDYYFSYGETVAKDGVAEAYFKVGRYLLSKEGLFENSDVRPVSSEMCSMLGVRKQQVYLSVANAAVARYDFSQSPPILADVKPVMSAPCNIRFTATAAYAPLGYSGVLVLE